MSVFIKSSSRPRVTPQLVPRIGKSERTRAAILDEALKFIWSHPFRDMTVNSLMASTGLTRSTYYQYFNDLYELMETLLGMLQEEIFEAAEPWTVGVGDPVALLGDSLAGLVRVGYEHGPLIRAVSDAATTDKRLEKAWKQFLGRFDDAACARIEADQQQGLIPEFDARPVAIALNRLDASMLIEAFGQRPRSKSEPVRKALTRIWISTLYGSEWFGDRPSNLVRT
ncbi:MAG: TetR/AcrR family transcriptional regulator [Rhodothermales bacterium]